MAGTFHSLIRSRRPSRRKPAPDGSALVVVGNGMIGARFLEELVKLKLHQNYQITVVGAEPYPAYNRVKLSSYVSHRSTRNLELLPRRWYEENGITLLTGTKAESINRVEKAVHLSNGGVLSYHHLVLATGSRPFVPPVPGADLEGVFLYRTIADLEAIISSAEGARTATVIGGGLLGIEAAQALQSLQLQTSIIERADFLMPQQLTREAGDRLRAEVEAQGLMVYPGIQKTVITSGEASLSLSLDEGRTLSADLVVISAGISPESTVAEEAGLSVGVRGGVVVDDHLETEDPSIFAIGECALLHGRTYGLAAPGYQMASHLARRLAGQKLRPLPEMDLSTRLKMLGVEVVTLGLPLEEGRRLEYHAGQHYRTLNIGPKGQLLGALALGPWSESSRVQEACQNREKISERQERDFLSGGPLYPGAAAQDPSTWPEQRIICNCTSARKGQILACMEACGHNPDLVAARTGASTVCGSCRPLLESLCGTTPTAPPRRRAATALQVVSILALCLTGYAIAAPPAPMADSVESFWYRVDQLWRDNLIKQITGYSLTAIFVIGLLISLRKRLPWFRWGHFARWRFFHSAFGLTSLAALWAHTGFHFGSNLNWWLMFVFVLLNLLGAVAGIVTAIEARTLSASARRLRPILTWAHLLLFWPLPVLLTFHILSVYLY